MSRTSKHRIVQSLLLLFWLGILLAETVPSVESQSCGNRPQFYNPNLPPTNYWPPSTTRVVVKIDGLFSSLQSDVIQRIIDGNEKWNNPLLTCSLVHFSDFETVLFTEEQYADPAPLNHVYWQVDAPNSPFNGGVFIDPGFGGLVFSARIKLKAGIVIPDPRFFNYLGTHEIGHTFGLDDCLSTKNPPCIADGLTIMGGHTNTAFDTQGPTSCDFAKVRELYCPPSSPTPTPTAEPSPWYWPYPCHLMNQSHARTAAGFGIFSTAHAISRNLTRNAHITAYLISHLNQVLVMTRLIIAPLCMAVRQGRSMEVPAVAVSRRLF